MNIAPMLTDSITIESPTGSDLYGKPTWGSKRVIKVRIETVNRRVPSNAGVSIFTVDVLTTDQPITAGDRYWRSGDDTSNELLAKMLGKVSFAKPLSGSATIYRVDL